MRLIDADALWMEVIHTMDYCDDVLEIIEHQKTIEPTHLNDSNTLKALDCVGRQEAIDAMYALVDGCVCDDEWKENPHIDAIIDTLENLPSAQPEPLSDAYMKAVWTWLIDYQIKAVELKGRYTPYEVLSWVANDWRKEHDRPD